MTGKPGTWAGIGVGKIVLGSREAAATVAVTNGDGTHPKARFRGASTGTCKGERMHGHATLFRAPLFEFNVAQHGTERGSSDGFVRRYAPTARSKGMLRERHAHHANDVFMIRVALCEFIPAYPPSRHVRAVRRYGQEARHRMPRAACRRPRRRRASSSTSSMTMTRSRYVQMAYGKPSSS